MVLELPVLASPNLVLGLLVVTEVVAFELVHGTLVGATTVVELKLAPDVGVLVHCIINRKQ